MFGQDGSEILVPLSPPHTIYSIVKRPTLRYHQLLYTFQELTDCIMALSSKLCRLREQASLRVLRGTWNKTSNPYLRLFTASFRPSLPFVRKVSIARPKYSGHSRPITAWLFFDGTEDELNHCTELILDFPGGGFIAMDPKQHEERLRMWAKRTKRPVLSVDYGKAPECTFFSGNP